MANPQPKSNVAPFTRAVVASMRKLFPEQLADKSFDNTGLLLESPFRPGHLKKSALITIDLTTAVADEAISRRVSIIIAYRKTPFLARSNAYSHPPKPIKSLTQGDTQQKTLLRLAQEGISVYCPHTAVDAAPGGLNDWLADIVVGGEGNSTRSIITPIKDPPPGFESAGYGRIVRFNQPQKLGNLVSAITSSLALTGVSVATPQTVPAGEKSQISISSIGICAGSGGSMLNNLDVDLLFTGELSHHEALAAIEKGVCVVTTFHSNSERAYFRKVMQPSLVNEVTQEIFEMKGRGDWEGDVEGEGEGEMVIFASDIDADPFQIISREQKW
ncbi:Uncharacterized protein BP5553_09186 [Venustampulla echinocandica]|uniref:NGG1p interacting factor 3 n=1 Tax=Venustampulla echinocandica TaxID=2656787 RepID=A0A370TC16_9HELO|nr:Uncharacterized protein BP5553_09186 [Venustampulla echinocandica]RDL31784.1 Uncharacterized protein BP5553_09186 [Venustampulla echinocandica]